MAEEVSAKPKSSYSSYTAFFFLVNYILGTGFLGIPYVMYHSGIISCTFTLMVITVFNCFGALWIIESMARAYALEKHSEEDSSRRLIDDEKPNYSTIDSKLSNDVRSLSFLSRRKFEITELCGCFFGKNVKLLCLLIVYVQITLASWSFTTVAASTWSSNIPFGNTTTLRQCTPEDFADNVIPTELGCLNSYRLCVGIYGVLVIILSCLELTEQKIIQIIMGLLRFFVVTFMCINSLYAYAVAHGNSHSVGNSVDIGQMNNLPDYNTTLSNANPVFYSFEGWLQAIPIFVYAELMHLGLPSMLEPVADKRNLHRLIVGVFCIMGFIYIFIGITISIRFQGSVAQIATLNWIQFSKEGNPTSLRVMSYIVIFFPSLDVLSAFPLSAIALSNNIYAALTGYDTTELEAVSHSRMKQIVLRLFVSVVPITCAFFVESLVTILRWAGLLGFFVCYFMPIGLQFFSRRMYRLKFVDNWSARYQASTEEVVEENQVEHTNLVYNKPMDTPYSSWFSGKKTLFVTLIYALTAFGFTIAGIVMSSGGSSHANRTHLDMTDIDYGY
ncbi:uncharacterized protein TRIADDRAFT_58062 [Trichoplax adhaerens]|uniref:Amino acid transporter transmembrane domain-containing protein n=1 Tax=Trichoplax adhaerens TaxID=10228 RepID=B3S2K9_TRIAD|nr:hypothetical protein TRIADDRAFT_58062 [Trichoplax adhaerens]EDV23112.1 hypothetical protein TRIADDRAFT_58062 [Trichoplax adhaerens]|eukprot:XP_002114022.1 hypothetical protein TRIADDRAFT_58062 [Trichoplax adhaerens]